MKNYTLFDVLLFIEFESSNIEYEELPKRLRDMRDEFWQTSKLLNVWWKLRKLSPSMNNIDWFFSHFLGGHISIGRLTVFGCNAMMYMTTWKSKTGTWCFRPPCFNTHWGIWTWGCLYFSPNGTPGHEEAVILWDDKY
ncbi:hypothetical protein [Dolichospermum phage Dfl-JY23]